MYQILATFIKELKVLIRDKTGLVILFAMPLFLVVISTLIQNEVYEGFSETGLPVLLVNYDNDRLGEEVEKGFQDLPVFKVSIGGADKYPDLLSIKKDVLKGNYLAALIIPKDATNLLRENVVEMISLLMQDSSSGGIDQLAKIEFKIIIDPVTRKSFVVAINSSLKEYVASLKTKVLFELLSNNINEILGNKSEVKLPDEDFFSFNEEYALPENKSKNYEPNAVQHNIPAWSIFSIFFIVLPLSVSIINERSEGLSIRLRTFPGSYILQLSGKLGLYLLIAIIQFLMVIFLGEYFFPFIGLPQLDIGDEYLALAVLTLCLSLAAIGYGLLIGTVFNAPPQASIFGGISILIMSSLGGIWVPVNLMPETMKYIAELSPLNWALTGFYELFIKGSGWGEIKFNVLKLFSFFIACITSSFLLYKVKHKFQ